MNKKFKKITTVIMSFLLVIAFSFTVMDSTAFARGSGGKSSSSSRNSPKSGFKSSSFSKANNKSSSTNTKNYSNKVSSRGSSWHFPTVIFWPFAGHYGFGYGYNPIGSFFNIIFLIIIIYFIVWFIRRKRRK